MSFTLLVAIVFACAVFIAYLFDRVKRLDAQHGRDRAELVTLLDQMQTTIFRSVVGGKQTKVADVADARELLEKIGYRLRANMPALRRVLSFTIAVSRQYFQERTDITDEELKGLDPHQLSDKFFWPASSVVIEEWATHQVVRDFSGHRATIYPGHRIWGEPYAIWEHVLARRQREWSNASLEVVLHERDIKFWGVDGRFGRQIPPEREARPENVFVVIPTNDEQLKQYRSPSDQPSDDPFIRIAQHEWVRHYNYEDPDDNFRWHLTVNDVVGYTDQ